MPSVGETGVGLHSKRSFAIIKKKKTLMQADPATSRSRVLFEPGCTRLPWVALEPACTRWRKSVPNRWARSHQETIFGVFWPGVCVPGWKEREKKKENTETERRQQPTQDCFVVWRRGQQGVNINTGSAVIAQQVIMITTCSLGSFSLIQFLSTYPS